MKWHIRLLALTILGSGALLCSPGKAALQGGFAKINITPPLGIPLIGSKGNPSDEILDDLFAKAMVLYDGRTKVAILSADLLYTPLEEITGPVRKLIRERTGIPETNVMVCATHTHSGPETFTLSKFRPEQRIPLSMLDQPYLQILIRKLADAVQIAHRDLCPVRIGLTKRALPELMFNRRTKKTDGTVVMSFSVPAEVAATRKIETDRDGQTCVSFSMPPSGSDLHFGPVDPAVWILRVEDTHDCLVGSILNYSCHPVSIYPSMPTTISADYPGHAMNLVEETEGGICLFTLGTAGDLVPYQRGQDACRIIGRSLGAEALKGLRSVPTSGDIPLEAIRNEIQFPAKRIEVSDNQDNANPAQEIITTEIQLLRLGDICILGLPGEVLAEVGFQIRKRSNLDKLVLVSLCNDAIGYVCHQEAYEEGGYEPGSATHLAKGAGEILIDAALDLIMTREKHPQ